MDLPPHLRAVVAATLVGVVGLVFGTGLALLVFLGAAFLGLSLDPVALIVVSLVLVQGVGFGTVALAYLRYRGFDLSYVGVQLPSLREVLVVSGGYVLALAAAMSGALIVAAAGLEAGANQAAELGLEHPETLLWLVPGSILLVGPGEELLFRGIVQRRIRESFGPISGVALASLLFAAVHFVALTGGVGARLVTILVLFFPALVFGAAYELTDNLVVPALIHGFYNATLFGLLYLAIRFGPEVAPELVGV